MGTMDINLLALNIGNSRLAIGAFVAGELMNVQRIDHADKAAWPAAIAAGWERIAGGARPAIAAAGVNPAVAEPLEALVVKLTGQQIQWVGREIELPIDVHTEVPTETGVDRVLNVAAAYEQIGAACAVVDAGTAVTVDFCDDQGNFVGGAISPGVRLMLAALHEKTARLPEVKMEPPRGIVGKSTADAMRVGVYHSIRGLVKELIENYATELGHWPELIATGGDATLLFDGWELVHAVAPDLTLYGIAMAYAEHHIKHDT
jgi:type III pantothenate kinase